MLYWFCFLCIYWYIYFGSKDFLVALKNFPGSFLAISNDHKVCLVLEFQIWYLLLVLQNLFCKLRVNFVLPRLSLRNLHFWFFVFFHQFDSSRALNFFNYFLIVIVWVIFVQIQIFLFHYLCIFFLQNLIGLLKYVFSLIHF